MGLAPQAEISISHQDRVERANGWFGQLIDIVNSADMVDAEAVLEYFNPNNGFRVTEPFRDGEQWGIRGKSGPDAPSITPLAKQDNDIHPYFDDLHRRYHAMYGEYGISIFMRYETPATRVAGIILLHEGYHGLSHANGLWRGNGEQSHWDEEVRAFELEHKVLRVLGGQDYDNLIKEWGPVIHERVISAPATVDELYKFIPKNILAALIDPEDTDESIGFLRTAFLLQAYFYTLDDSFDLPEDISRHADFVRWFYSKAEQPLAA